METFRVPICLWQDAGGQHTATVVDPAHEITAIRPTAQAAIEEVADYLRWRYEQAFDFPKPDFLDPQLITLKIPLRGEYKIEERIHPCTSSLPVRVHCVHGRQEAGLLVASLPMWGIRFSFHDPADLRDLATRYVQLATGGATPRVISRYLAPANVRLDEVVIRLKSRPPVDEKSPETPTLSLVAEPLGDRAVRKQYARAWERDREATELSTRFEKRQNNVLLVGESGVGKTTLLVEAVRGLEKRWHDEQIQRAIFGAKENEPPPEEEGPFPNRRFWSTSAARLIAGMQYLGQWEERVEEVISELSDIRGILCLENLLDLIRTGGREPLASVAAFLMPYLQRGELQAVAEVTPAELLACRRLLPGLADLFQIVHVTPLARNSALAVIDRLAGGLKQSYSCELERGAGELVYQLYRRFLPYQTFPGRTGSFLNELFERAGRRDATEIRQKDVIDLFVEQTGLPEIFLRDEVTLSNDEVFHNFHQQVIGQVDACRAAARLVTTFKAGVNDPRRPLGVLLFCGPTGVGKTELAKALAAFFFGHGHKGDRMVRLDMSEYAGYGAAERLLGPPDGEPGELVRSVRQQPLSVILLDEIEKAAPEVFDVLLGVFDEGRLTDRYGRTTDFRSTILIMTSNLGAQRSAPVGFERGAAPPYATAAEQFFRPEFFNRLDGVVSFQPLEHDTILAVTRKELSEVARREGLMRGDWRLVWSDGLVEHLAQVGCDPRFGARPLQRTIERLVVAPLAKFLLDTLPRSGAEIRLGWQGALTIELRK